LLEVKIIILGSAKAHADGCQGFFPKQEACEIEQQSLAFFGGSWGVIGIDGGFEAIVIRDNKDFLHKFPLQTFF